MSEKIAPGKWDADKRLRAKFIAPFVGFVLIAIGAVLSYVLIVKAIEAGSEITMIAAAIAMVPMAIGAAALFPNIVVPIIYRLINRDGDDSE